MAMTDSIIEVSGLSKRYRLGQIGINTLQETLLHWWYRATGRDPVEKMGIVDTAGPREDRPRELWALRDVSFRVRQGEVLGVIGRNGAGKSTLLKILTRITAPTAGRAVLGGRVSSLLEVGTGFHPDLTGRENIYVNGAILGMKKAEIDRKLDDIVDFSEIGRFIDTPVKRYSSGMYVRLAFAVASQLEPDIMLVDEVLAVGDIGFQRKCLGRMQSVARDGRTVLFVSHNMAAIQSLCSRAILMEGGRLAFDGSAGDAVAAYLKSAQGLIETRSIGERTDREGGKKFRFLGVEFLDGTTRAPLNVGISGQPLLLRVGYVNRLDTAMRGVVLSVAFSTSDARFLFACRSDAVGSEFEVPPGPGEACLRIPRLPLNQGRYFFTVIAYQGGEIIDWVKEAGFLDVTAGDYYGTGKLPAAAIQGVFIDFGWSGELGRDPAAGGR